MTAQEVRGPVAVVTGASRGAGKGIALALGHCGMTVYVTGRTRGAADSRHGGCIAQTAALIDAVGGKGIAMATDHADDAAVTQLFARVGQENGQLDILVNNAAKIPDPQPGSFWDSLMRYAHPGRDS
jgi:NAD(P)-dependent dehydrogenase (short-subunit alcohol dehydrogenase family)